MSTQQQAIAVIDASSASALFSRDVQSGLGERFAIRVKNTSNQVQKVALISAYFDTRENAGRAGGDVVQINSNGFNVAAVAFDGIKTGVGLQSDGVTPGTIEFSSGNPATTIDAFSRYIKTNPRMLQSMLIVANDQNAFSGSLELTKASPTGNGRMVPIDLNQFFSPQQYQPDRIILDFSNVPLEISDDLVMALNIPANTTMEFNFRF
jgi:hypothetical protein